jgi:hypothetical protein
MKHKGIFTAILLITIGVLCLLQLYEVVHFSWWAALRLWPLLLIWIGVKCLPISEAWKLILKILVLFFGVFLLFYLSNSNYFSCKNWSFCCNNKYECKEIYEVNESYFTAENDDENIMDSIVKLNLTASAGKLTFEQGNSLFSIENNRNSEQITTKVFKRTDEKKTTITASITPIKNFPRNDKSLNYNVLISDIPVWEMKLELNATANEIDLSAFKVKELEIESNASAVNLKLGNLYEDVEVTINSNASSVSIKLPEDMRCIINRDNKLSSMKVHGFKKQNDGSYLSAKGIEAVGTVYLSVDASVSAVDIKKY